MPIYYEKPIVFNFLKLYNIVMPDKKLNQKVLRYLKGNRLMTLGTSYKDRPWSATVFFAFDNDVNILFFSREDTRHCQNIKKNKFVSIGINQDWGKPGLVKGLQITGIASRISKKQHAKFYPLYCARFPWAAEFPDHSLYVIKSTEIHYIDQNFFGHFHRVKIL